jgi:adenine-specific DNA-methyltransferase
MNSLLRIIDKKKIFVPTLDRHPYNRFSLGSEKILPAGDVVFIQPFNDNDLTFLLGFLNSTFFRQYYLANGGRRGGRIAFTQRLLENVKIPLFPDDVKNNIREITEKIIYNLENNNPITYLEKELDSLINNFVKKLNNETKKIGKTQFQLPLF